jgi:FlaA1/EpsC-like NDP-sugar epimerase
VSIALRYDSYDPPVLPSVPLGLWLVAAFSVATLFFAGTYRAVIRAFDESFLRQLVWGVGATVFVLSALVGVGFLPMPRSVPFIYGFFMFLWVWASRSAIRQVVRVLLLVEGPTTRIGIYGAGAAGRQILAALRAAPEYAPVMFFDDEEQLIGTLVQGLRVYRGADFGSVSKAMRLDEVILALPSVTRSRRREVIERIEPSNVRVRTMPGIAHLVGSVSVSDIQAVDIADLLGRDAVPPSPELLSGDIEGKRVMVTGGGGSIGSELCRQVAAGRPELLLICELNEFALYTVEQELRARWDGVPIVAVLGSVLDEAKMYRLIVQHKIQTVYHAAAYKHVPLVECNPFEGLINNSIGTLRAARSAIKGGVAKFVLVSTDKAVRPTSVMGASKRLAELALQALAAEPNSSTKLCMVRFGNVLGSSGSVVPLFKEQIAKGGPVTVTHPEMTRYFMTIPEAAQLVIQAGAMAFGGDVFVLDMGEPVKIVDLARRMIRLCGSSVRADGNDAGGVEITFSGLRPGEKLYEELLIGSNVTSTEHPQISRAIEDMISLPQIERALEVVEQLAANHDLPGMRRLLTGLVNGYSSETPVGARGNEGPSPAVSVASPSPTAAPHPWRPIFDA